MKLLHIIDSLDMGGAQSFLAELLPIQKRMGNEVAVLELRAATDRTFAERLNEADIPVYSLSKKRSCRSPMNIFAIMPYFRQYDVVHTHLFPANYWTALAKILSLSRTPIITTEHNTTNKRRGHRLMRILDGFIYNRYRAIVACSEIAAETFMQDFPGTKVNFISNGVNVNRYRSALPYSKNELVGISEEDFLAVMVARFNYPKRQDTLVESLSMLPSRFHIAFVGGNSKDGRLQEISKLSEEKGVARRVHFLYSRPDIPRILKTADAVVLSSEYEGLSLSSIEGMASGKPFIGTNVNGLREVISGYGEMFKCGDAKALAEIFSRLASDRTYYDSIASKCTKRANEFDISKTALRYMDLYENILDGRPKTDS